MAKKKTQEEFYKEVYELTNGEYYVIGKYKNAKSKILIRHNCRDCNNHEWEVTPNDFLSKKRNCPICLSKRPAYNKTTYEQAKQYIESHGCKLISKEFNNINEKLIIECQCGNVFNASLRYFKKGKVKCDKCSSKRDNIYNAIRLPLNEVKNEFVKRDYIPLFDTYKNNTEKLPIQDKIGYKYVISYGSFSRGKNPQPFNTSNPYTIDNINNYLKINNIDCELLSTEYKGIYRDLKWKCSCGNIFDMQWNAFKKSEKKCFKCVRCGERSHFWNGGISTVNEYLRTCIKPWKEKSMYKDNYKCIITGNKFDVIHHLYGFELIARETLEKCELPLHDQISMYTDEELEKLRETCLELHFQYGLGACLTNEIHKKFHELYGSKNNTPEQFYEFKININNGGFNNGR